MALFLIRRHVPAATQEDIDAAAVRAIACALEFPGLRWITSYWDRAAEETLCMYEAKSAQEIAEHARRARIACDEVRPVEQFGPIDYVSGAEPHAEGGGAQR